MSCFTTHSNPPPINPQYVGENAKTSLKKLESIKLTSDLESKAIGPPDSKDKSLGTPQHLDDQRKHL